MTFLYLMILSFPFLPIILFYPNVEFNYGHLNLARAMISKFNYDIALKWRLVFQSFISFMRSFVRCPEEKYVSELGLDRVCVCGAFFFIIIFYMFAYVRGPFNELKDSTNTI